jgi:hypothetical protein
LWRIGQRLPARAKFLIYDGTTQRTCLRLMGRKMLVALMMEGKFSGEGGLHSMDADDDILAAMARELVEKGGVGDVVHEEAVLAVVEYVWTHCPLQPGGFWAEWFVEASDQVRLIEQLLRWPCYGDPGFTFSDVEHALRQEVRARDYLSAIE